MGSIERKEQWEKTEKGIKEDKIKAKKGGD